MTGRDAGPGTRVDVVVVGGGPAGAATAVALARRRMRVALVRRPAGRRPPLGETVPGGIVTPLSRLGLWESFLADGHLPSTGTVACWGGPTPYERDALLDPHGGGWHLDRARFDGRLLAAAADAGVHVRSGSVLECAPGPGGWTVRATGPGPGRLRARWVVDASGRSARVARRQGAGRIRGDRLVGLARFSRTADGADADPRTVVEATEAGWWYVAPLPGARTVTVLFTDADLLPRDPARRARCWADQLAATRLARERLGVTGASPSTSPPSDPSPLWTAPAGSGVLTAPCGPGWLAVGDAAQTWDPLSGQGIPTALGSAEQAAEVLVAGRPDGAGLERYAASVHAGFRAHLRQRSVHYGRETRWVDSPFWRRRADGVRAGTPPRSTGRTARPAPSSTAGAAGAA